MIGSYGSEGDRPAIFLPEQVEILAHGGFLEDLFFRSLQTLVCQGFWNGRFFTLWTVAEVLIGRKSIGGYFWPCEEHTGYGHGFTNRSEKMYYESQSRKAKPA